jgi:hypothetical protein
MRILDDWSRSSDESLMVIPNVSGMSDLSLTSLHVAIKLSFFERKMEFEVEVHFHFLLTSN